MLKISTSGSTGEPFTTYADRYQLEVRFATTLRGSEWTGWRFGDRQARLWHQTLGMTRVQVRPRAASTRWFMRRLFIPAFEIDADEHRAFHRRDPPAPPGARRRVRRVAQLPRDLRSRGRPPRVLAEGDHVVRAGPARQRARADRDGFRHEGLRQVRRAASSPASRTSAVTRPTTTWSTRRTSSSCSSTGARRCPARSARS